MRFILDYYLAFVIVVAESCGGAALLLLEDAVEVTDVVKTATIAYLSNACRSIHQQTSCMSQSDVNHII